MNAVTFSPTSCQLKLAICRRRPNFGPFTVPVIHRRNVRFVVVKVRGSAANGNELERRSDQNSSWVNLNASRDGFSGWGSDGVEPRSEELNKKRSLLGIIGAGVAGLIVFSGLTYCIVYLSSRGASRVKDPMVPLTSQQEKELSVDDDHYRTENEGDGDNVATTGSGSEESETPLIKDPSFDSENALVPESRIGDDGDEGEPFENGDDFVSKSNGGESDQSSVSSNVSDQPPTTDTGYDSPGPPPDTEISSDGVTSQNPGELATDIEVKNDVAVFESGSNGVDTMDSGTIPSVSDVEQSKESLNLPVDQNLIGELQESAYESQEKSLENDLSAGPSLVDPTSLGKTSPSAGIPAPSAVSSALQVNPGKIVVPAVVDELQTQALSALQILKVIEDDVKPGDLCTRREYARWLVLASSVLSRSVSSKVYPAMYIENASEIAFDDITPEDPDFQSIQGLAEAGLIASKLSRRDLQQNDYEDTSPFYFSPESPLSRQDLVTWRMALDKKQLAIVDQKTLQQVSGFIDIDKIDPEAWPALVADIAAAEQSIVTLAFGYTRLFQPGKPVTKGQAAIALSTGDASTIVGEELARIEAESMAENAVAAHSALVAQVENELGENYQKELFLEREKINTVEKLAEEAKREVEKLRAAREEENLSMVKQRAAVDSEMELLSRLRRDVEEQLQAVMADKLEISYEKERFNKLRREAEAENQEITRLQHELEIERKALSMAREWAEEEAKRAREHAKALDEARNPWRRQGIEVVVDKDLGDEAEAGVTWLGAAEQFPVEETVERAETLVDRIKTMAGEVGARTRNTLSRIIDMIVSFISNLKKRIGETQQAAKSRWDSSIQYLEDDSTGLASAVKENAKRISEDCKEGLERLSQRFKT